MLTDLAVAVVVLDSVTTLEGAMTCVTTWVVTDASDGAVCVTVVLGAGAVDVSVETLYTTEPAVAVVVELAVRVMESDCDCAFTRMFP